MPLQGQDLVNMSLPSRFIIPRFASFPTIDLSTREIRPARHAHVDLRFTRAQPGGNPQSVINDMPKVTIKNGVEKYFVQQNNAKTEISESKAISRCHLCIGPTHDIVPKRPGEPAVIFSTVERLLRMTRMINGRAEGVNIFAKRAAKKDIGSYEYCGTYKVERLHLGCQLDEHPDMCYIWKARVGDLSKDEKKVTRETIRHLLQELAVACKSKPGKKHEEVRFYQCLRDWSFSEACAAFKATFTQERGKGRKEEDSIQTAIDRAWTTAQEELITNKNLQLTCILLTCSGWDETSLNIWREARGDIIPREPSPEL
jgi:hypothetical protein